MPKPFFLSPAAERDLLDLAAYIAEDSAEQAQRFIDAAIGTLRDLGEMPGVGRPYAVDHPRLEGLRRWRVQGFPNHLIFYLDQPDRVLVVRVLHGARDLPGVLEEEGEEQGET